MRDRVDKKKVQYLPLGNLLWSREREEKQQNSANDSLFIIAIIATQKRKDAVRLCVIFVTGRKYIDFFFNLPFKKKNP